MGEEQPLSRGVVARISRAGRVYAKPGTQQTPKRITNAASPPLPSSGGWRGTRRRVRGAGRRTPNPPTRFPELWLRARLPWALGKPRVLESGVVSPEAPGVGPQPQLLVPSLPGPWHGSWKEHRPGRQVDLGPVPSPEVLASSLYVQEPQCPGLQSGNDNSMGHVGPFIRDK